MMNFHPIFRASDIKLKPNNLEALFCRISYLKSQHDRKLPLLEVSANFRAVGYIFGPAKASTSNSVVLKMDNNKNFSDVVLTKQRRLPVKRQREGTLSEL